jgi:hypothetical protein
MLSSGFSGTIAGPCNPPRNKLATEVTKRLLVPPWQLVQPYLLKSGLTSFWNETVTEGVGSEEGRTPISCEQLARNGKNIKVKMSEFVFFMNENSAGGYSMHKSPTGVADRAFMSFKNPYRKSNSFRVPTNPASVSSL